MFVIEDLFLEKKCYGFELKVSLLEFEKLN